MIKVDGTVRRETLNILKWTAVLSAVMQAIALIVGVWDYTVLLGNLLGGAAAVLNFFLMGLTVQSCLGKDPKEAQGKMKASQTYRMLMLFLVALVGHLVPCFNLWAVVAPYFFPRVAILLRYFSLKKGEKDSQGSGGENDEQS